VLVALRLEEIEEGEFPVARLETVSTVADLVGIVRAWSTMPSRRDERETLLPPLGALNNAHRMHVIVAIPARVL
jgi:hypothetical protein